MLILRIFHPFSIKIIKIIPDQATKLVKTFGVDVITYLDKYLLTLRWSVVSTYSIRYSNCILHLNTINCIPVPDKTLWSSVKSTFSKFSLLSHSPTAANLTLHPSGAAPPSTTPPTTPPDTPTAACFTSTPEGAAHPVTPTAACFNSMPEGAAHLITQSKIPTPTSIIVTQSQSLDLFESLGRPGIDDPMSLGVRPFDRIKFRRRQDNSICRVKVEKVFNHGKSSRWW